MAAKENGKGVPTTSEGYARWQLVLDSQECPVQVCQRAWAIWILGI